MQIESLELQSFRNYRLQRAEFDPKCNVIFGENAQGKTNLLEAMVYLSCGKSPRARSDREMIGFSESAASLSAHVLARDRDFLVKAELFRDRRRTNTVNPITSKKNADCIQGFNTVYYCTEALYLIREGAAARRKFMDTALCQLRPRYAAALSEYSRTYDHKVRILRDAEQRPDLLDTLPEFNERLVRYGAVLVHYRCQFAARLAEYAAIHHRQCSGEREELEISYQTVSSITDPAADIQTLTEQLRSHMAAHQAAERSSRLCLSGPHKDDLAVKINGQDARGFASQGQTRTAALSMKLAEREIYHNATGEYPVLLLDDVLSELDQRRQEFVLNRIAGGQVFITCCEDDRLSQMLGGKVLHVRDGALVP